MIAVLVAAAWGGAVLALAATQRHPVPHRVVALGARHRATRSRRPLDPRVRRLAPALGAGLVTALLLPLVAPGVVVAVWWVPIARQRRRRRRGEAEVRRSLPEVVDLFALAVGAGLTVPLAVDAVGRRHDGPLGPRLRAAAQAVASGQRCADALDDLAIEAGPLLRPLVGALTASERYGAPLGEALDRLAAEARADRRRRAEEAARRVPVRLLFPLVLCVLPAFGLLTLAPLLAGALGSLRL